MITTDNRDPQLWRQAKAQARFKGQVFIFVLVNALLWAIWALTGQEMRPIPWPLWATFFWGLALLGKGARTYNWYGASQTVEREYEQLLRQREQ